MKPMDAPLAQGFHELGLLRIAEQTLPEIFQRITGIANDAIAGSAMVGLTLDVGGASSSAAFTAEEVPEIEQVQHATGVGPCVHAARHGLAIVIASTPNDARWKAFSNRCADHGVLSTLSVPILARSAKRAALTFYGRCEGAFSADDVSLATAFAGQAAIAIENAEAYWSARQLAEQLGVALESRVVIEQAKGLLMAEGRTGDAAFEVLRTRSQSDNRKLRDIAAEIVMEAEARSQHRQHQQS